MPGRLSFAEDEFTAMGARLLALHLNNRMALAVLNKGCMEAPLLARQGQTFAQQDFST